MNRLMVWALLASMVVFLPGCGAPRTDDTDITMIDLTTLRSAMEEDRKSPKHLVIIDPRPGAKFAEGHIPGSINLRLPDVDRVEGRNPAIAGHHMIVVYGQDPASAVAKGMTKKLIELRYKRVKMYGGGITDWEAAGLSLEKSPGG